MIPRALLREHIHPNVETDDAKSSVFFFEKEKGPGLFIKAMHMAIFIECKKFS
jgi:hypothetical protein